MTKEKIRELYLGLQIGYDSAIYQLKLLGMTEKQADDYLIDLDD